MSIKFTNTPRPIGEQIIAYVTGTANMVTVRVIRTRSGDYVYHIEEPIPSSTVEELYTEVMEYLRTHPEVLRSYSESTKSPVVMLRSAIDHALEYLGRREVLTQEEYETITYYVMRDRLGWGIIDPLMKDDRVEEITLTSVGRPISVVMKLAEVKARWVDTNIVLDRDETVELLEFLAQKSGKQISISQPILEARTPEGYRLAANLDEVSFSPSFTIRKFPKEVFSIVHLLDFGTVSPLLVAYLWTLLEHQKFVMIVGLMGSGKTTLLQALLSTIPRDRKVLTIEDTPELRLRHPRWQALYTRPSVFGAEQEITLYDLIRHSLRTRADYIVVGEVRDKEIYPLLQVVASGYGSLCTMHADSPESLFFRMTTPPMNVPPAFMSMIAAVVHTGEVELLSGEKARRVLRVWEITGVKRAASALEVPVEYHTLFSWDETEDRILPDKVEEIVEKSYHIRVIGESMYGRRFWRKIMAYELKQKARVLENLHKKGIYSYDAVTDYIYRARTAISAKINEYRRRLLERGVAT